MEPYQERLLEECNELENKIILLEKFIDHSSKFSELEYEDKNIMRTQLLIMKSYFNILNLRLTKMNIVYDANWEVKLKEFLVRQEKYFREEYMVDQ